VRLEMKTLVLMGLFFCAPLALHAQGNSNPCGNLENKTGILERVARYFEDPSQASVLEGLGIARAVAYVPREVVEDRRVCNPLMGKARAQLGKSGLMAQLHPGGFEFAVLRFGPYSVVAVIQNPAKGEFPAHPYSELLIFDWETSEYLGSIVE